MHGAGTDTPSFPVTQYIARLFIRHHAIPAVGPNTFTHGYNATTMYVLWCNWPVSKESQLPCCLRELHIHPILSYPQDTAERSERTTYRTLTKQIWRALTRDILIPKRSTAHHITARRRRMHAPANKNRRISDEISSLLYSHTRTDRNERLWEKEHTIRYRGLTPKLNILASRPDKELARAPTGRNYARDDLHQNCTPYYSAPTK